MRQFFRFGHKTLPSLVLPLAIVLLSSPPTAVQGQAQPPAQGQNPANAQGPQQPQPATPAAINAAIEKGKQFLRSNQNPTGGWGKGTKPGSDGGWAVGYAALAGLTLIECGIPTSDAGIQAAAKGVRAFYLDLDSTYEVALAILFLDRMGDKSDKAKIQLLAGRLIAGQSASGGWGYKVPSKSKPDIDLLFSALKKLAPPQTPTGPNPRERPGSLGLCIKMSEDISLKQEQAYDSTKAKKDAIASLSPGLKKLPVFADIASLQTDDPKDKQNDTLTPTTDNSNTHFATLGLWAARKYDVPAERSFALLTNRFRTSQGPEGSWAYPYVRNGQNGSPAMTCVALLGLAIGHVLTADASVRPEKDPQVISAFTLLSRVIGQPAGRTDGRPTPKSVGGLYFLWGMERIAVLYDVRQLDNKDWYQWGAEILLCHQKSDGSWADGGFHAEHPVLNTCFALLFLKRANLTPDLSRRLTIDASVLTEKVSTTPKPEPPAPKPPEPTPVVIEMAPPPHPMVQKPKSTPAPEPVATTPAASSPPPPAAKSKLPWIIGIVLLVVAGVGCVFFAVMKKNKSDQDEEKPRKKKKTKEGSDNGNGKHKSKAKTKLTSKHVDVDEDD